MARASGKAASLSVWIPALIKILDPSMLWCTSSPSSNWSCPFGFIPSKYLQGQRHHGVFWWQRHGEMRGMSDWCATHQSSVQAHFWRFWQADTHLTHYRLSRQAASGGHVVTERATCGGHFWTSKIKKMNLNFWFLAMNAGVSWKKFW